jgi:hypothetical protein
MPTARRGGQTRHLTGSLFLLEARMHEQGRSGGTRPALEARNGVGVGHWEAERYADAVAVLEPVVEECRHVLGTADPDTLVAAGNLAMAYVHLERWEQGLALLAENVAARERTFGEADPLTMTARHAQATALQMAGRLPEALATFSTVAAQRSRVLGPAHPDALASRVGGGVGGAAGGASAAGVPGLASALQDAEQSVGPHTVSTVTIRIHLADCHAELGNLDEAVDGLQRAAADCEAVLGAGSPLVGTLQREASALQGARAAHERDGVRPAGVASEAFGR